MSRQGKQHNKSSKQNSKGVPSTSKKSNWDTYLEELEQMTVNYTALATVHEKCEDNIVALQAECDRLKQEKSQLEDLNSKHILARNRLESLCRVLHVQNKKSVVRLVQERNTTYIIKRAKEHVQGMITEGASDINCFIFKSHSSHQHKDETNPNPSERDVEQETYEATGSRECEATKTIKITEQLQEENKALAADNKGNADTNKDEKGGQHESSLLQATAFKSNSKSDTLGENRPNQEELIRPTTSLTDIISDFNGEALQEHNSDPDETSGSRREAHILFAFHTPPEQLVEIDTLLTEQKRLAKQNIQKQNVEVQEEQRLWHSDRIQLINKLNQSQMLSAEFQEQILKIESELETYYKKNEALISAKAHNSEKLKKSKQSIEKLNTNISYLLSEVMKSKEDLHQSSLSIFRAKLESQDQETQLSDSGKQIEILQNLCSKLVIDMSTLSNVLKGQGIHPNLLSNFSNDDLTAPEKQLMLKPIICQLIAIREYCVNEKEKLIYNALEYIFAQAQSKTQIDSAINLCLGFLNIKTADAPFSNYTFTDAESENASTSALP